MKTMVRLLIIFLFLSLFFLPACALTTANVDLAYMPKSKSPLITIKPMMIALQIEDKRNQEERDRVGNKKNNLGMVTAPVKAKKEVTLVLYDALKNEINNNGHKTVDKKEDNYDAFIRVLLKKYWSDTKVHFWDIEMIGTINANISILNPQNGSVLFSKALNSTFRESKIMATDEAFKSVLNGALVEFVRSFSRDTAVLKALKKLQDESKS